MVDFNTCQTMKNGNIRTPKCRLSYVYLEKPNPKAKVTSGKNAGSFKYTVSLLIPKTADISLLQKAAQAAAVEEHGAEKVKAWMEMGKFNSPFLDAFKASRTEKNPGGDERMKDFILIRTDSLERPGIVESDGKSIGDNFSGVYSGRWAFVTLNASAYPAIDGGKPGVKFYLGNIQLLDHDERLGGGRPSAEDEFEAVPGIASESAPSTGSDEAVDTDSLFGMGG